MEISLKTFDSYLVSEANYACPDNWSCDRATKFAPSGNSGTPERAYLTSDTPERAYSQNKMTRICMIAFLFFYGYIKIENFQTKKFRQKKLWTINFRTHFREFRTKKFRTNTTLKSKHDTKKMLKLIVILS